MRRRFTVPRGRWKVVFTRGAGDLCGQVYDRFRTRQDARNARRYYCGTWRAKVGDSRRQG